VIGKELFTQHENSVTHKLGIRPLVCLVAMLCYLVQGKAADQSDEYLQISKSVILEDINKFTKIIIDEFGSQYLNRCPTAEEKESITTLMASRGFPGCFASWDVKKHIWKNCPMRLAGQHIDRHGNKSLTLEAIADPHLYFWYIFFGEPGSMNDINTLNKSSIVGSILTQAFNTKIPPYTINGKTRDYLYFLADGIYPNWSIFAKTIGEPISSMQKKYSRRHEYVRKDVERAFGVLVARFQYLKYPIHQHSLDDICNCLYTCIIFHNMIVEYNRDVLGMHTFNDVMDVQNQDIDIGGPPDFTMFAAQGQGVDMFPGDDVDAIQNRTSYIMYCQEEILKDIQMYHELQTDLVEHINNTRNS
jgi:hypothetical protein